MASVSALIDLNATFGALFIGFGVSSVAFGILSMQMYSYFRRYPSDVWWYKQIVGLIWVLELVDQALIGHAAYFYVVSNWGTLRVLLEPPIWSLIVGLSDFCSYDTTLNASLILHQSQVAIGATVGCIVKICYGMRVYRFSRHNVPVTTLIMLGALAQLAAAFYFTIQGFSVPSLAQVGDLKTVGTISLSIGMGTDVITSVALAWFLRNLKTGHKKSRRRDDNRLIIYGINTGSISSVLSLCTLVLYNVMPTNFIFALFYFILSKVYANSFYAALNTRRSVRGRGTENEKTTVPTFLMVGNTATLKSQHNVPAMSYAATTPSASHGGLSPGGLSPKVEHQDLRNMMPHVHYQNNSVFDSNAYAARQDRFREDFVAQDLHSKQWV
ncbi:uncharacterized protein BXZ73DRAFT_100470 [Epithele typhae]|uniref:uncharacterized protein n=1 Tax=Epithele typhae TaxID=378194 RepID=UPI002007CB67|nr:uncharacterized protein BXZ73DRAFT_100470 [Epithele typhae]KAH9935995.1 hypothetical protein BXZ73DRAFT_100470 [Epithele typhae]